MEEKREQNTEEKKLLYFNCERFMYRENRNFGRRDKKPEILKWERTVDNKISSN